MIIGTHTHIKCFNYKTLNYGVQFLAKKKQMVPQLFQLADSSSLLLFVERKTFCDS